MPLEVGARLRRLVEDGARRRARRARDRLQREAARERIPLGLDRALPDEVGHVGGLRAPLQQPEHEEEDRQREKEEDEQPEPPRVRPQRRPLLDDDAAPRLDDRLGGRVDRRRGRRRRRFGHARSVLRADTGANSLSRDGET